MTWICVFQICAISIKGGTFEFSMLHYSSNICLIKIVIHLVRRAYKYFPHNSTTILFIYALIHSCNRLQTIWSFSVKNGERHVHRFPTGQDISQVLCQINTNIYFEKNSHCAIVRLYKLSFSVWKNWYFPCKCRNLGICIHSNVS